MSADIKHQCELFLCEKLASAVPDHTFYPYHGGTAALGAEEIEPPFTVVMLDGAEKTHPNEGTWICNGTIQTITHHKESSVQAHTELSRSVYAALDLSPQATGTFILHGIDITKVSTAEDDQLQCRATVIAFTAGVSG